MPTRILRDWTDSESVSLLDWQAEVFFVRLIMKVDDYGRFPATPKLLRSLLFPLKDGLRDADISRGLVECQKAGLIAVYEVGGKPFLEIKNFGQRLRAMKSKYPPPPDDVGQMSVNCQTDDSQTPDKRRPEAEARIEVGDEKGGEACAPPPAAPQSTPSLPHVLGIESLRESKAFCDAWADWKRHLAEKGRDMTRQQEAAVLTRCVRWGAVRAVQILRYSIEKGANNPIEDAPRPKGAPREPGSGTPEPDPDGWKRFLGEHYPDHEGLAYADAKDYLRAEFRRSTPKKP